jgi:hypothetical protein
MKTSVLDAYLPVENGTREYAVHIMTGFFEELQKRKVYRVAAGFLTQIVSAVFPAWDLPNWKQQRS